MGITVAAGATSCRAVMELMVDPHACGYRRCAAPRGGAIRARSGPSRSYLGEPVLLLRNAAVHRLEKERLQLGGDRSAHTAADGAVVELANRRDFRGGAGEER